MHTNVIQTTGLYSARHGSHQQVAEVADGNHACAWLVVEDVIHAVDTVTLFVKLNPPCFSVLHNNAGDVPVIKRKK